MRILIFGATGMVGQGVLRECLLDGDVTRVLCVGRQPCGQTHPKLRDLVLPDLADLSAVRDQLADFDACFFCLGVSSVGMKEEDYRRVTYDLTLAIAGTLAPLSPQMTFVYVTGAGTDSSERGASMWARVKGATENALMRLPFRAAYMFRPGMIQPMHAVRSKTGLYRLAYVVAAPIFGLMHRIAPDRITTSERVGRAMLAVAKHGAPSPLVEMADINALGR
ncbi:NAD-dependent epimerase/dehydratase family protein [Variovorax sp. J22P168]|uniref:NAD-dependent epimerase/dehydratase family protein n=1 Tax=Variovorax jilinensis TaxID=3053513 RepID=UPI0025769307|nr:NAD-dependent epimerase/dehydratase family protein [Variovorax sp. J22P168]MDM0012863.1 NAD-dependent epimerase/dehydratase family protein [Variovorax sp. J22P168]